MSCKQIIAQALSDDNDDLSFEIVKPAIEKTRSDGAEVAGIHNTRLAKQLNNGNFDALFFHHSSGLDITLFPSILDWNSILGMLSR